MIIAAPTISEKYIDSPKRIKLKIKVKTMHKYDIGWSLDIAIYLKLKVFK